MENNKNLIKDELFEDNPGKWEQCISVIFSQNYLNSYGDIAWKMYKELKQPKKVLIRFWKIRKT